MIDDHKVIGPQKDIIEVQNAIKAYNQLKTYEPYKIEHFLKAHNLLMNGLIRSSGEFRRTQSGIMRGDQITHIALGADMVPGLMNDLFNYLENDEDLEIIKSCVFHYEMEYIHPFEDGNGRIGRYWQTRILMNVNPIFEFVPIEKLIKDNQQEYYKGLNISDNTEKATVFIEFMLDVINETLRDTIFKKYLADAAAWRNKWVAANRGK